MLAMSLIVSVFIFFLGFSVAGWISRRAWIIAASKIMSQEKKILLMRSAMNEVLHEVSHNGVNPISKSFRGLLDTTNPFWSKIFSDLEMAERPGHHLYAGLAKKNLLKVKESWDMTYGLCKNAEVKMSDSLKKLNDIMD